jgi:diaminohydroxyphosphoribosylaminopyrimidine deaminase/5-amino-6-(5-phosphoribosylamino)uracil reductase
MYLYCALPLSDDGSEVLLEMAEPFRREHNQKLRALKDMGVEVIGLASSCKQGQKPQVDLAAMAHDLGQKAMNEIHIEAGATLNGALIESDLIDEFLIYMAPKWIGPARPMSSLHALQDLSQALALDFQSISLVGEDLRIVAQRKGAKTPLSPTLP